MIPSSLASRGRKRVSTLPLAIGLLLTFVASLTSREVPAADVRTVTLSDAAAPGTSFNFRDFNAPILNSSDQAAFIAEINDDEFNPSSGLWSEGSGPLANVALQGQSAPGTALDIGTFMDPNVNYYLNNAGQAAFEQTLADFSTAGLFSETGAGNALQKVAAGGDSAPGTTDTNRVFNDTLGITGGFNDSGQATFQAYMPPTAAPPGNFPSNGVWSQGSGTLDKIAEVADAAPGTAAIFDNFYTPSINNSGQVAFVGHINLGGTGDGVWTNVPGPLTRLVGNNDPAPGGGNFSIIFNHTTAINGNGDVAFSAELQGGAVPDGIWVSRGGGIDKVAVEGDVAPGAGGATFSDSGAGIDATTLGLDSAGDAAFTAQLSDGRFGLFSEAFGGLNPVALTGDVAPDTGGLTFLGIPHWTINDGGQAAFVAELSDFTDAIFAQDQFGTLHEVVAEGQMLEVAPGDFRQIEFLSFQGLNGSDSGHINNFSSGFSADASIAFSASFLDGSSGVFVTQLVVPEPSSLVLFALGFAGLLWRNRRRK
jgi:PEP-CTERM motif